MAQAGVIIFSIIHRLADVSNHFIQYFFRCFLITQAIFQEIKIYHRGRHDLFDIIMKFHTDLHSFFFLGVVNRFTDTFFLLYMISNINYSPNNGRPVAINYLRYDCFNVKQGPSLRTARNVY